MASVKKTTKKDETAAQEMTAGQAQGGAQQPESAGTANDTGAPGTTATAQQSGVQAGYTKYVYVGPPLPRGTLNYGAVLEGTMDEITEYLSAVLEDYPQVRRLIVPVHRLADASTKARTPGNILNKYYSDVVSAVQSRNRKE